MGYSRRKFIQNAAGSTAAIALSAYLPKFSAASYNRIIGANDMIRVASMGVNSRGLAVTKNFARQKGCEILYVCDVDKRAAEKCIKTVSDLTGTTPKNQPDFRKALEDKNVDVLMVAAPDHWHAPAAILGCKAGKHIYVEKPCSHNPNEGEILVKAADKYKRVVQMGNQRRSWPNLVNAINEIKNGAIGKPYYAKCWYTNNRASIGIGKATPVPGWLDFDLWQGPAPRRQFKDNLLHYNWHWFWHWGTGEALNNGVHMVDLARWGLGVDYPKKVTSFGGRYCFKDDWETPDTQIINLDFGSKGVISWEGRSCNPAPIEGATTGVIFYGDKGSLMIDAGNSYKIIDNNKNIIKDVKHTENIDATNLQNPSEILDAGHIINFFNGIRKNEKLHSPINEGHISTLLVQLGNISVRTGSTLHINPANGHILNNAAANKLWSRQYQPGWEVKV